MRRALAWPLAPRRRTLTALVALLAAAFFIATGTGFWLLYRMAYLLALGAPLALLLAWLNTRGLEARAERRTLRAQWGQEAEELIEVRTAASCPSSGWRWRTPATCPATAPGRALAIPARGRHGWGGGDAPAPPRPLRLGAAARARGRPLRLFQSTRDYGRAQQILVYPAWWTCPASRRPPPACPARAASAAAPTTSRPTPAARATTPPATP